MVGLWHVLLLASPAGAWETAVGGVCREIQQLWFGDQRPPPPRTDLRKIVFGAGQGTSGTRQLAAWANEIVRKDVYHQYSTVNKFTEVEGVESMQQESDRHHQAKAGAKSIVKKLFKAVQNVAERDTFDFALWPEHVAAVFDSPIPDLLPWLLLAYPNAKVILSKRNARQWVASRAMNHGEHAQNPLGTLVYDSGAGPRGQRWGAVGSPLHDVISHGIGKEANYTEFLEFEYAGVGRNPNSQTGAVSTLGLAAELHHVMVRCLVPPDRLLEVNVFETDDDVVRAKLRLFLADTM